MLNRRIPLTLSLIVGLGSCTLGPDFKPPEAPQVTGYTQQPLAEQTEKTDVKDGETQHFTVGQDIPAQWWQLFHSKALNDLIEEALKANPDLDAAQAALRQAQENTAAGQGAYYPQLSGDFSPSRQKQSNVTTSNLNTNAYVYNLFSAGVNVSYAPDIFGGTRRTVEGLEALQNQQRYQLEATYLTLTSNLVAAAIEEASLRGQIEATQDILNVEKKQLDILQRQKDLGEVGGTDVLAQEAVLAQAEQNLPALQKQLEQQRDLLAALAGHFPSEDIVQKFKLSDLQLPKELPVTLPAKLVEQRPDIRAAEEQLHTASAGIGVAEANRLPQITLSGNVGSLATTLATLFTPGNGFWTIAADVSQPIFEGGTLLHRKRAADAAYDEAAAQYRSTVVSAFQNVADTLHALDADAKALKAAVRAEHAASKSFAIVQKQLALGEVGYLEVLTAEQTWQQTKINLVQVEANRYADTAALFQALGGGWWNRQDVKTNDDADIDNKKD